MTMKLLHHLFSFSRLGFHYYVLNAVYFISAHGFCLSFTFFEDTFFDFGLCMLKTTVSACRIV